MANLYLAHQLDTRNDIRKWEIEFEKKYKINLVNPFYDCPNREDIQKMDKMTKNEVKKYLLSRTEEECRIIVERDLKMIRQCDGMIAFVTSSIGTSMEIIMAYRVFNMPVFVITDRYYNHAWIKMNSTKQFKTREEFEGWFDAIYSKQGQQGTD